MITITMAMRETNAFIATIFEISYPIFIMAIMIFRNEIEFDWKQIVGAGVAILGISMTIKH